MFHWKLWKQKCEHSIPFPCQNSVVTSGQRRGWATPKHWTRCVLLGYGNTVHGLGSWQLSLSADYLPADEFQLPVTQHWGITSSVGWHLTLQNTISPRLQFYKILHINAFSAPNDWIVPCTFAVVLQKITGLLAQKCLGISHCSQRFKAGWFKKVQAVQLHWAPSSSSASGTVFGVFTMDLWSVIWER